VTQLAARALRRGAVLFACGALGVGALTLGEPSARADSTFEGVADARLVAVNFTVEPGVVFPQLVDAGGSVAQASLSSLGVSTAFASDPYPSESAVLLPGLIAGLTNGATSPLPPYPLIVSSNFPAIPEKVVHAGSVVLDARSNAADSRGSTSNGANTGAAEVSRDPGSDRVTARSEVAGSAITLSDSLVLNGVHSVATAVRDPSGKIQLSSAFEVSALTIAGQRVPLSDGLVGPDGALTAANAGGQALLDALAQQGISISYLPSARTADGITSAGLRIRSVQAPPPQLASGIDRVVTETTIGLTSVRVVNRGLPDATGGLGTGLSDGAAQNGAAQNGTAPNGVAPGVDTAGLPGAVPGALPNTGPVPAGTTPTNLVTPTGSISASALVTHIDTGRFYLVLLLAGAALLGWIAVIRVVGGAPAAKEAGE
jgi:hypothetical protein